MSIKTVLFGKVDLDTMATALVMGVDPLRQVFRRVAGSASQNDLSDSSTLCIEVGDPGGSERTTSITTTVVKLFSRR